MADDSNLTHEVSDAGPLPGEVVLLDCVLDESFTLGLEQTGTPRTSTMAEEQRRGLGPLSVLCDELVDDTALEVECMIRVKYFSRSYCLSRKCYRRVIVIFLALREIDW